MKMELADMTEPVIAFVDPATLTRLETFAESVLPGSTDPAQFPYIVGKILADLSAAGLEWAAR